MGKGEVYKKFFLQKSVLDTLRIYITIGDGFLEHLKQSNILGEEDLAVVQMLDWPRNRDVLLQTLIKKTWTKEEFESFCDFLEKTQDVTLVTNITKKKDEYFKDKEEMTFEVGTGIPNIAWGSVIDDVLTGMSLQDQNKVRRILKEKDDIIRKKDSEIEQLHNKIEDLTADNSEMRIRLHTLDHAATDLVSAFHYEHEPETVEEGLGIVRKILDSRQKQIDTLEGHIKSLTLKYQQQKEWTSKLTTEILELKATNEKLEKELEEQKQKYSRETFEQATTIEELEGEKKRFQRKVKAMESYYSKEIKEREEEMSHIKREMAIAERMQNNAEREKNKVLEEMDTVKNKTRKLLVSMNLENEVDKLGVSVDFARDIAYATKRRGSRMNSIAKVNPIVLGGSQRRDSEDALYSNVNLPWGNTPQDIQARRDSVSIEQMFPPLVPRPMEADTSGESKSNRGLLAPVNFPNGDIATPRKNSYRNKLPPLGEH